MTMFFLTKLEYILLTAGPFAHMEGLEPVFYPWDLPLFFTTFLDFWRSRGSPLLMNPQMKTLQKFVQPHYDKTPFTLGTIMFVKIQTNKRL